MYRFLPRHRPVSGAYYIRLSMPTFCSSLWLLTHKPPTDYLFLDENRRLGLATRIKKQITKFAITNEELGIVTC